MTDPATKAAEAMQPLAFIEGLRTALYRRFPVGHFDRLRYIVIAADKICAILRQRAENIEGGERGEPRNP